MKYITFLVAFGTKSKNKSRMISLLRSSTFRQLCLASKTNHFISSSTCRISPTKPSSVWSRSAPQSFGARSPFVGFIPVASLHQSSKKSILPPLPQVIHGTANDAAPVPSPEPSHGSYHWTFERLISAGLVPLTLAPFAAGSLNPATDALLCGAILIHSHIGFEAVIIDYLPRKRVPTLRLVSWWGLRAATVVVGIGLYEFETNDVGLTEAISRIWRA